MATPWFLRSSLRMLISILVILALPTIVLTALVTAHMRAELRDRAVLQNGLAAQVVARTTDRELRSLCRYLESFASQPDVAASLAAGDRDHLRTQLRWLVAQNGRISRVFITNLSGVELVDYPHDPSVIGMSFAHRDWFRGVSAKDAPYVSGFYRRAAFGQPNTIAVAVPVRAPDGRGAAYLVGQYTAADMMSWLWNARPTPDGWVGIVDAQGHYIRSGQPDADYHDVTDLEGLPAAMAVGAEWVLVEDPLRGEQVLVNHTAIPAIGWSVIAAQPSATVFASLNSLFVTIAAYFATCFVGAGTLGFLWFRTLRRYDNRRRDVELELRIAHSTLERRVAERTSELAIKNRELQDFAYVASHDLQEPLRKIQAFGGRLRDRVGGELPDTAADYLDRMTKSAERMQTLISDLLSFSRITTRTEPFVPVPLDRVLREVLSDLEVRIEQTNGKIVCGPLPAVYGDRTQLRQLFQNVLGNALKFHRPEVPPHITINASAPSREREAARGGHPVDVIHIDITDNGIGFDNVYRDRIFQPFQRLHGRGEYDGTGIGLAICRRIVERHAGAITASGTPNGGAHFRITLPVRQIHEGADECVNSTPVSSSSSPMMTSTIAN